MAYGSHQPASSFVLHDGKSGFMGNVGDSRYHNGDHSYLHQGGVGNYSNNAPFQLHQTEPGMFASPPPQVSSPQHRINQLMSEPRQAHNDGATLEKNRGTGIMHAPIPTPPVDDMEPQSISFIGEQSLKIKLDPTALLLSFFNIDLTVDLDFTFYFLPLISVISASSRFLLSN